MIAPSLKAERQKMKINYETGCIIEGNKGNYLVIMERLKNDINGCPRWKARVIMLENKIYKFIVPDPKRITTIIWKGYGNEEQKATTLIKEYETKRK